MCYDRITLREEFRYCAADQELKCESDKEDFDEDENFSGLISDEDEITRDDQDENNYNLPDLS